MADGAMTSTETSTGRESGTDGIRHDWTVPEALALLDLPFNDLVFRAQTVHRRFFDPNAVQVSTLLSVKTGGCPEDCAYCPQSAHYSTGVTKQSLMALDAVLDAARQAKAAGASRFCMGAAWRSPADRDLDAVCAMVEGVRALGLESCATLGMLTGPQARRLKDAGLDFYNHNIDTSPEFYPEIISTRVYEDRLRTLAAVRRAGITVCSGGILGMGESEEDRIGLLQQLAEQQIGPNDLDALVAALPRLHALDFVAAEGVREGIDHDQRRPVISNIAFGWDIQESRTQRSMPRLRSRQDGITACQRQDFEAPQLRQFHLLGLSNVYEAKVDIFGVVFRRQKEAMTGFDRIA